MADEGGDGDEDERRELPPSLAQQEAMSRLSKSTAGWRLQEIAHRESERELKELQGCTFEPTLKWEYHKGEHGFTPSPEGRKSPKRKGNACFRLYETMKMKEELEMMYAQVLTKQASFYVDLHGMPACSQGFCIGLDGFARVTMGLQ